ncbi:MULTISPECIES: carbohydrate ABC transporter permease [Paenibacillus]|uniref:carbohydrate ABC transporter permease n=1 Tax=Paenibacillus TaxID=44249 RepID=UPI00164CDFB0|nr:MULTISPECIES: carbohydrate ABC transporter permease [Paenibacillus]QNK55848.1 carbohydrate ABC transporter permease [Paenibacillus sp. PAMC21692]
MKDRSWGNRLFDSANYLLLTIVALVMILPFIYVIAVSFATPEEIAQRGFILFPTQFSLSAYAYIFSTDTLLRSLGTSIYITLMGTFINLFFTSMMAYPLAKRHLRGREKILLLVLFTMLFNGGMIPTYFVVKDVGLIDSLWALMIPGAISAFNLIIMKNFFQQVPYELEESAKIDGCNDLGILFRIVIPLSLPAMATIGLFYAVTHWNTFFNAILYINDSSKWPLQVLLRDIVMLANDRFGDQSAVERSDFHPITIRMAVIVFATVPILLVYPFLMKHFAKGAMMGSVKG